MPAPDATSSLWDFVLRLYAQPGVPAACLSIQDRHGIDVPLMLFGVWLGERGIDLSPQQASTAREGVAAWQSEIVKGLRHVRQRLKSGPPPAPSEATEALRTIVKRAELEGERLQLVWLEEYAASWPQAVPSADRAGSIAANMAILFSAMTNSAPDPAAQHDLDVLGQAVKHASAHAVKG